MEIGEKLKEKRTVLGLSQEQLAEKLGVTRQTIAVQFRWLLSALPKVKINFNGKDAMMSCDMEWFPNWDGDPEPVNSTKYRGDAKTSIQFSENWVNTLNLVEEYHWGDRVETRVLELPLHEKHGCFYLPENPAKRYDEGEQYILYRFDWDGGEFLFCLKFQ